MNNYINIQNNVPESMLLQLNAVINQQKALQSISQQSMNVNQLTIPAMSLNLEKRRATTDLTPGQDLQKKLKTELQMHQLNNMKLAQMQMKNAMMMKQLKQQKANSQMLAQEQQTNLLLQNIIQAETLRLQELDYLKNCANGQGKQEVPMSSNQILQKIIEAKQAQQVQANINAEIMNKIVSMKQNQINQSNQYFTKLVPNQNKPQAGLNQNMNLASTFANISSLSLNQAKLPNISVQETALFAENLKEQDKLDKLKELMTFANMKAKIDILNLKPEQKVSPKNGDATL